VRGVGLRHPRGKVEVQAAGGPYDQNSLDVVALTDDFNVLTAQRMQPVVDDRRIFGLIPGSM
jgi:hypothetical protein